MDKKGNYKDCLKFIKDELHIRLLDFQKRIIKAYFEDEAIIIPRGVGKTMCMKALAKYIAHINGLTIDENNPDETYVDK